jgi:hypothetical protein
MSEELLPMSLKDASWKLYILLGFTRTAITKEQRLSGFNNRNSFSHSSGGLKSKMKVLAGLVTSEVSLCGCQMVTFSLYIFTKT